MKFRFGFTLIELLVVVAIIAILISILLPTLAHSRENARRTAVLSQLHAIGVNMATYQADFDKQLPTNLTEANADDRTFEGLAVLAAVNNIPAKFFVNPQLPDTPATARTAEGLLVFADVDGVPITLTSPAALTAADMPHVRFHASFAYDHEPKKGADASRLRIYVADRADYLSGRTMSPAWVYKKGITTLWSDQHAEFVTSTASALQEDPNIYHHNQYFDDAGTPGAGEGAGESHDGVSVTPTTIDTHLRFFSEDEDDALLPNP